MASSSLRVLLPMVLFSQCSADVPTQGWFKEAMTVGNKQFPTLGLWASGLQKVGKEDMCFWGPPVEGKRAEGIDRRDFNDALLQCYAELPHNIKFADPPNQANKKANSFHFSNFPGTETDQQRCDKKRRCRHYTIRLQEFLKAENLKFLEPTNLTDARGRVRTWYALPDCKDAAGNRKTIYLEGHATCTERDDHTKLRKSLIECPAGVHNPAADENCIPKAAKACLDYLAQYDDVFRTARCGQI